MSRRLALLAVVWFFGLLVIPGLATIWSTRSTIGNRAVQPFPETSRSGVADASTFAGIDDWFEDRLSVRELAIDTHARLSLDVFGDSTIDAVLVGHDDWLYLQDTFTKACRDTLAIQDVLDGLDTVAIDLEAEGIELQWTVVPEKAWIHPERLPGSIVDLDCAREVNVALRSAAATDRHYIDLWGASERAAEGSIEPLYWRTDTHWNPHGRTAVVSSLVDALSPDVWEPETIVEHGRVDSPSDLYDLLGHSGTEVGVDFVVERRDVEVRSRRLDFGIRLQAETTSASTRVVEGKTVLISDSHLVNSSTILAPWFRDLVIVRAARIDDPAVAAQLGSADRIVVSFSARDARDGLVRAGQAISERR